MRLLASRRLEVPAQRVRRLLFASLVLGTGVLGTGMMLRIVGQGGMTLLEMLILALFAPTFVWISIAFWNAVIGCALLLARRHPLTLAASGPELPADPVTAELPLRTRTALVIPARHEPMDRVLAGVGGMVTALEASGHGAAFDLHLLSDTTDPTFAVTEEVAWSTFERAHDGAVTLHYRRRTANEGRKAGNIAEFCRRSAERYDFMVVLDADSVMRADALIELVRIMEANPGAGLVQTVPLPARQHTWFGRLVQMGATLHSRLLATGQSFWQGDAANYWGHNAIVRLDAFVRHARLPVLRGRPPLGGEILSHDFVEAALIRRAGWGVYLLPEVEGSYEEVPGNIPDFAARDRRWAQGSLQHLRLLGMSGLHPLSRLHFMLGAMGYVSSVLWCALLLAGSAYVLWPAASGGPSLAGWPVGSGVGAGPSVSLLGVTAVLLFLPKALGVGAAAVRDAAGYGGLGRLFAGALAEAAFAVVVAPVMMMYHVRAVSGVLAGRNVSWGAHAREGRRVSWQEAWRGTTWITAAGLAWGGVTAWISPSFLLWLAPILVGLLLAAPLVLATSRTASGAGGAAALGWLMVPHEIDPPRELSGTVDGLHVPIGAAVGHGVAPWRGARPGRSAAARPTPDLETGS